MVSRNEDSALESATAILAHVLEMVQEDSPEAKAFLERVSMGVEKIQDAFAVLERVTDERLQKALLSQERKAKGLNSQLDYWVVLTQGKGDRRHSLHSGAGDKQSAINLAYQVSEHYRASICFARIINLKDSILLELDEGDLLSAQNDEGQPIKVNSTRF